MAVFLELQLSFVLFIIILPPFTSFTALSYKMRFFTYSVPVAFGMKTTKPILRFILWRLIIKDHCTLKNKQTNNAELYQIGELQSGSQKPTPNILKENNQRVTSWQSWISLRSHNSCYFPHAKEAYLLPNPILAESTTW